jgi:hypothetical protein
MLSNAFKLLVLAMAFLYVAARPESEDIPLETEADEMDIEVPETEDDAGMDNVDAMTNEKRQFNVRPVRCPFDCAKTSIIKYPFSWGVPPKTYYFYRSDLRVYRCCKSACAYYQNCVRFRPAWACYADVMDRLCSCRRRYTYIKFEVKEFREQVKAKPGK